MHKHAQRRIVTPTARSAIVAFSPSIRTDRMATAERTTSASSESVGVWLLPARSLLARSGRTTRLAPLRGGSEGKKRRLQSLQSSIKSVCQLKSSHLHPLLLQLISSIFLPLCESRCEVFVNSAFQVRSR
jgi:hypothetical protein